MQPEKELEILFSAKLFNSSHVSYILIQKQGDPSLTFSIQGFYFPLPMKAMHMLPIKRPFQY